MRPALAYLIRGGNDWSSAATLLGFAGIAYLITMLHPFPLDLVWMQATPLGFFAAALGIAAAWHIPNRPAALIPAKAAIAGMAIYFCVIIPVARWWPLQGV